MGYRLWVIEAIFLLNTVFVFGQSPSIVFSESDAELLKDAKVIGKKTQVLTLDNYTASAEKIVQYLEITDIRLRL